MLGWVVEPEAVDLPVDLSSRRVRLYSVKASQVAVSGHNLVDIVDERVVGGCDGGSLPGREE
jgi:hypothetical protein